MAKHKKALEIVFRGAFLIAALVFIAWYEFKPSNNYNCEVISTDIFKDYRGSWSKTIDLGNYNAFTIYNNFFITSLPLCDKVVAYDLSTGTEVWSLKVPMPWDFVIDNNAMYIATGEYDSFVTAIDLDHQEKLWESPKYPKSSVIPLGVIDDILLMHQNDNLRGINIHTGAVESNYPLYNSSSRILFSNNFVWCLCDHMLLGLDPIINEQKVAIESELIPECCLRGIVTRDDFILAFFTQGGLLGIDANTNEVLWKTSEWDVASNLIMVGDFFYFLSNRYTLEQRNLLTGKGNTFLQFSIHEESHDTLCSESTASICGSWLASNEIVVVVYLQDRNQLIAIPLLPS